MNAVEIEQAISELAEQPFDAAEFPYAFLIAFGNKETFTLPLTATPMSFYRWGDVGYRTQNACTIG